MPGKLGTIIKGAFGTRGYQTYRRIRGSVRHPGFTSRLWFDRLAGQGKLSDLGRYYGTNKVDKELQFNNLSYLDIYERYLHTRREEPVALLEIGVLKGESLKTWKAYFKKGAIHGIDINPTCKQYEEDRIRIEIGSQDDAKFLSTCFGEQTRFDIILDDGSHINRLTIASFESLFSTRLNPGGIYIIEDLQCSYKKLQSEHDIRKTWSGMAFNDPDQNYDNDRAEMDRFFAEKVRKLDHLQGDILSLHFWAMTCVILKV